MPALIRRVDSDNGLEYPCWLLKSVLLQGYMYITTRHVCFYAYLPKKGVSGIGLFLQTETDRGALEYRDKIWLAVQAREE